MVRARAYTIEQEMKNLIFMPEELNVQNNCNFFSFCRMGLNGNGKCWRNAWMSYKCLNFGVYDVRYVTRSSSKRASADNLTIIKCENKCAISLRKYSYVGKKKINEKNLEEKSNRNEQFLLFRSQIEMENSNFRQLDILIHKYVHIREDKIQKQTNKQTIEKRETSQKNENRMNQKTKN